MSLQPESAVMQTSDQIATRTTTENKLFAEKHETAHANASVSIQRGKCLGMKAFEYVCIHDN